MRRIILSLTALAALAACSESPTEVADSAPVFAQASAARVVASVSGSGHALCSADGATCNSEEGDRALRTSSLSARLYADGTAHGNARFNNRGREQAWKADVECVLFRPSKPNQVWMMGTLTHGYGQAPSPSGIPYEVGTRVLFAVEDNGEGHAAVALDRLVGFATVPEAQFQQLCPVFNAQIEVLPFDDFMAFFGFNATHGNIQVRPPSSD